MIVTYVISVNCSEQGGHTLGLSSNNMLDVLLISINMVRRQCETKCQFLLLCCGICEQEKDEHCNNCRKNQREMSDTNFANQEELYSASSSNGSTQDYHFGYGICT
ncbi:hypothetical protein RDI58_023068 [Solanum bulbocastanum]|uniref:Uncharacterized protein n=1 Tax=Solanum bulbocastanum TaxID=147425 RepID=A0AAN8T3U3_SOLBU